MNRTTTNPSWQPVYICYRPDTKSKEPHARCRQYVFHTTPDLRKWLSARKNSDERIKIEYCPTAVIADTTTIEGARKDLALREEWPL
jgi:hypothetical protein